MPRFCPHERNGPVAAERHGWCLPTRRRAAHHRDRLDHEHTRNGVMDDMNMQRLMRRSTSIVIVIGSVTAGAAASAQSLPHKNWAVLTTTIPEDAVVVGKDTDGAPLYACVVVYNGTIQVGKTHNNWGTCAFGWNGAELQVRGGEILVTNWTYEASGVVPSGAAPTGWNLLSNLWPCRSYLANTPSLVPGYTYPGSTGCTIAYGGSTETPEYYYAMDNVFSMTSVSGNGTIPLGNLVGGHEADGTPLYMCSGNVSSNNTVPGKTRSDWAACNVASLGSEVATTPYSSLVPLYSPWNPYAYRTPYQPGVDADGTKLGICRVNYNGSIQVGKYHSGTSCDFTWGGREIYYTSVYEYLVINGETSIY